MRFYKVSLVCFILFWASFILMDYWQMHPVYANNLAHFQYFDLVGVLGLLGAGVVFGVKQLQKRSSWKKWVNGLSVYAFGLLIISISIQFYLSKNNIDKGDGAIWKALWLVTTTSICAYLVVLFSYVLGQTVTQFVPLNLKKMSKVIVHIAIGIMGLTGILFLLGAIQQLKWFFVVPICLVLLAWRWRTTLDFVKKTLIEPIPLTKKLNSLGIVSFYILLITVSWTLLQVNMPFPRGWDALSLYAALPSLLNDYQALVKGFQPYNWSLFMSLGFVVFNKIEVVLMLSYLGGLLSLFALYRIARGVFKMDVNYSLLSVSIFHLLPTIGFQSIHDQKVDLGLLFVMLTIVILFVHWVEERFEKGQTTTGKIDPYIALIGLLAGFALGVKLTTLFIFFGVLAAIWYVLQGKWGFLALFAVSIFGILLLKLDETAGLRAYHLGASYVQWTMLLIGLGLSAWLFTQNRTKFLKGLRLSILFGFFFTLPMLPWFGKNYLESKNLSVQSLLNGKSNAPNGSIKEFTKNLKKYNQ